MPDIRPDNILRADDLQGATDKEPMQGLIKSVKFVEAVDLGFESRDGKGRWELMIKLPHEEETLSLIPNKTSLKALIAVIGKKSEDWPEKEIGLYSVNQNVGGDMKDVVYCK